MGPDERRAQRPIGVFDSGLGGLTVLKALTLLLPGEDFVYVGDTARVPYGSKSPESVRRFAREVGRFFRRRDVKLLVAACNTVSALALRDLRAVLPAPVLGVIEPGARAALAATRRKRIGVIGTLATVRSRAYPEALRRLDPALRVFSAPCPLFVPLVEEGWLSHPVTRTVAGLYLAPLLRNRIDTLILGCTHYPLIEPTIRRAAAGVEPIDSARETAKAVRSRLEQDGLLRPPRARSRLEFHSSDDPETFRSHGRRFLGRDPGPVSRISLEGVDR